MQIFVKVMNFQEEFYFKRNSARMHYIY